MINTILCLIIAFELTLHHIERRDLYNRIMAKDYKEYKQDGKPPKRPISAHERVLKRWRQKRGEDD